MGLTRKTGKEKFGGKAFTRKPYDKFLYTWNPKSDLSKKGARPRVGVRAPFCDAKPFSQGEDFFTTYVYEFLIIDGIEHRYAYVECDYVQ